MPVLDGTTDVIQPDAECPTPADLSTYKTPQFPNPSGKHQGKCSQVQLDDYRSCVTGAAVKCATFAMGQPGEGCFQCIETKKTDAVWGPILVEGMSTLLNVEGCLNLALGQTGPSSCGELLFDAYACQSSACDATCSGNDASKPACYQNALAGACRVYADPFATSCSFAIAEGGVPEATACFPSSDNEPTIDHQMRLVTYFCGP